VFKILRDIENMASYTPASVGESVEWTSIVNTAEGNRASYCKALIGNPLHRILYGPYTVSLYELKAVLKTGTPAGQTQSPKASGEQPTQDEGFKEVRSRKRHNTDEAARTSKDISSAGQNVYRVNTPRGRHPKLFHRPEDNGHGHRFFRYWVQST
jgi:hypothetical protein